MIPTIFSAGFIDTIDYDETVSPYIPPFPDHGIVDLVDCIECVAEETADDGHSWELELVYPQSGLGFNEIQIDRLILAKANNHQRHQVFRIYSIEKNIKQTITVRAQHISYDMNNVPVKVFSATGSTNACTKLRTNTIYGSNWKQHHFYFSSDIGSSDPFKLDEPKSLRAALLDGDNSLKGTYGGDIIFNNHRVYLNQTGGEDRGVVINYGVDLIDMTQEINNSEMITGILPYYKKSESDDGYEANPIVYGNVVYGPGSYSVQKISPVDLTEFFPNSVPTVAQLTTKGAEWVSAEKIGEPEISLTVSYANLGQNVQIHDAIKVLFPKMGIDVMAKVSRYKYDVLRERCVEIDVGHAKTSKYFDLLDASKLKKGLIPPDRISKNSITSDKISKEAVKSSNIAKGGVGKGNIAGGSVGKMEMEPMSIDEDILTQKAVTNSMLRDNIIKKNDYSSDYPDGHQYLLNQVNVHPAQLPKKAFRYTDSGTGNNSKKPTLFDLNPEIVTANTLPGGKLTTGTVTKGKTAQAVQDSLANGDEAAGVTSTIYSKNNKALFCNYIFIEGQQCAVRQVRIVVPGGNDQTFYCVKPI